MISAILWFAVLSPDVVLLEDGSRLVGRVVSKDRQGSVECVGRLGRVKILASQIDQVLLRADFAGALRSVDVATSPPHARWTMAAWALDRGLYEDSFVLADSLLSDPSTTDLPAVHELQDRLRNEAVLGNLTPAEVLQPADLEELLHIAAGDSLAKSAVASAWLVAEQASDLLPVLQKSLRSSDENLRLVAVDLLGRVDADSTHGRAALGSLVERSLNDDSERVRQQALLPLTRHSGDRAVLATYSRATRSSKPSVRLASYASLEALGNPRGIAALITRLSMLQSAGSQGTVRSHIFIGEQRAYLRDFEVEIAQGAVIADPVIGILSTGSVLDVRVAGTSMSIGAERARLIGALERWSGREFGADVDLWAAWWAEQGQQWVTAWELDRASAAK